MKKNRSRLVLQFVIGFLILGALISSITASIGYFHFKGYIERQYHEQASHVSFVARSYLEKIELKYYYDLAKNISYGKEYSEVELKKLVETPEYKKVSQDFISLKNNMQANDIYLVYLNLDILKEYQGTRDGWKPLTFIFDCYNLNSYCFNFGVQNSFNPAFIDEAYQMVTTGNYSDNYFISKSYHGYNTTALLPVRVNGVEEYLLLGVELPMQLIRQALTQYLVNTALITVGITIGVILIYMLYLYFQVISPLRKMTKEVQIFARNMEQRSNRIGSIRSRNEIGILARSILKMEDDLITYIHHLTLVTQEKERIEAELSIATQIQLSMLPSIKNFPKHEEFEIYALMTPAKAVGGDFYDFFMADETHLAIVVADVSGKGIPAALFMVIGKTLLKEHTKGNQDLEITFQRVNQLLCESNKEGLFITAFEGILDLKSGKFIYVNAGHEIPFITRERKGFVAYKIEPDFVLAGFEETTYMAGEFMLQPGDKLFQYTDGVTEATDSNNTLYGVTRLEHTLNEVKDCSPKDILLHIKQDIDHFVEDAPQFDDITMLCLEYKGNKEEK